LKHQFEVRKDNCILLLKQLGSSFL